MSPYIADLHIHSRYSRATSKDCTPEYLDLWARKKGIELLGTGDFTHPAWRKELEDKLVSAEDGFYQLKDELRIQDRAAAGKNPRFVVSGEISSIYKKNGKVRKVHNLILLPGLAEAEMLARKLETIGNIHSDGRPILGLDSRDLLEITLEVCPRAIFVPAHIWTPHFSMFGAFSGFDTVEECFEDLTPYIHAIETGLSSDPPMNWRLSALDRFQMISNSDAHSPAKLGREANLLQTSMSYHSLYDAIQKGTGLAGTIEFFPEEGKYHYDGHRKCHLCLAPVQTEQYEGKCPVCGKKLTLGVFHRLEQLADRTEGYIRPNAAEFESLVPLAEVIAASIGRTAASVAVQNQYEKMLKRLGTEFSILREVPIKEIQKEAGILTAEGIHRLRQGKVTRFPGFDGEYGTIQLFENWEREAMDGQISLFGWTAMDANKEKPEGVKNEEKAREQTAAGLERNLEEGPGKKPETGKKRKKEKREEDKNCKNQRKAEEIHQTEELNKEQQEAVWSVSPRIAVMAGPGTGKTKTLVSRIGYLLQNRRIKPSEITAVTFTNQAAREIRARLENQFGGKGGAGKLQIGTFHALCYERLKKSETLEAGLTLADEDMVLELVKEIREEMGLKESPGILRQAISKRKTGLSEEADGRSALAGNFKKEYSILPNEKEKKEKENQDVIQQVLACYQERMAAWKLLDFDDLLLLALEQAEAEESRFPYLLIDEFQDISPLQYRLVQAWSKGSREIFIIGDPDQAIYGFRGADSESFQQFCMEEKAEIIHLKKNYRSRPEILTASQAVLKKRGQPLEPVMKTGLPVRLICAANEMGEAIVAAKEINRLVGGIDMLDAQEGAGGHGCFSPRSFSDIAILYRTHRQAEILETCLKKEGIPYIVAGREEFLKEDCIRGSLGFFRSLAGSQSHIWKAVCIRIFPVLGQDSNWENATERYIKFLCKSEKPQHILQTWIQDMGLQENPSMEKLVAMAVFYKTMEEMLTALSFGRESDLKRCGQKRYHSDAVTLMTIHGSKGLEFPVVFLHGARAGMIPLEYGETDLEEERRLLYVAMTRAKEELIITSYGKLSPFLKGITEPVIIQETVRSKMEEDGGRQMSLFDFIPG